jgi:DNA-binding transcriptional MerR regulator
MGEGKMDALSAEQGPEQIRRISDVVQQTGLSKELVHHYIRQGLLPKSQARARYSDQQVRLLRQIRTLREDHHLPLEVIRQLFTIFEFDPAHIEALTLSDSLSKRVSEFAERGDLLSARTLSADELAREAGISSERLTEVVRARLVEPLEVHGEQRFSVYDVKVLALCERGVEQGIAFEAFRTIAAYVRIAFDLAHAVFFDVPPAIEVDAERVLADLFVRRELAGSFVQNVLMALTQLRFMGVLDQPRGQPVMVAELVYRPSPLFVRAHGLEEHIEQAQEEVRRHPDDRSLKLRAAELLIHAGRYDEATFFLAETLDRRPDDAGMRGAFGWASVLLGNAAEGERELDQMAAGDDADALVLVRLSLLQYSRAHADRHPETLIRDAVPLVKNVDRALALTDRGPGPTTVEARMFSGWLLAALPRAFPAHARGLSLLGEVVAELRQRPADDRGLPGMHERHLINAAFLLFDSLRRLGPPTEAAATPPMPSLGELQALICRLDPGCAFAETTFLAETDLTDDGSTTGP